MLNKIISIIADQLHMDTDQITESTDVVDELGADSLDIVEILMCLEDAFLVEIPDEAVEGMRTPGDIAAYIEKEKGE